MLKPTSTFLTSIFKAYHYKSLEVRRTQEEDILLPKEKLSLSLRVKYLNTEIHIHYDYTTGRVKISIRKSTIFLKDSI